MSNERIMVVEDEWIISSLIQKSLKKLGYTVSSAVASGEEAVLKAEEDKPDLVLMDIVLAGEMDGVEAASRIKALLNIPAIYLTSYTDKNILERAKITGPFGYILKPFEERELYTTIEMALYKHSADEKLHKLSHAIEHSSATIVITDIQGNIEYVNQKFVDLTGYSIEEAIGKNPRIVQSGRTLPGVYKDMWKTIVSGRDWHGEICNKKKSGELYWEYVTISPVKNSDDVITNYIAVKEDITKRKQAEEGLRNSERKNRTWLENSPACTKIVDLDFNLQYMSAAGVKSLKIEDITPFYGNPYPFDFYPESFRSTMTSNLKKVKETGEIITQEASVADINGNELWFHSTLVPVNDHEDRLDYILIISMDITERKMADKQIDGINKLKEYLIGRGDLEEKLKRITNDVVRLFNADFCRIWTVKPGDLCETGCIHARVTNNQHLCRHRNCCLHLIASSGRYTHVNGDHRRVPFGCYKIGLLADGSYPQLLTNDVTSDQRVHDNGWASNIGLVSFAGFRLLSSTGVPIGVLALFSKHKISQADKNMIESIVSAASLVIQTSEAERKLKEYQQNLETLAFGSEKK